MPSSDAGSTQLAPAPPKALELATSLGPARAFVHVAPARPTALLVLGHGAGRGADTLDLMALAAVLPSRGVTVVRLDQPWVVAGRRVAVAPHQLDVAWRECVPAVRTALAPSAPLFVGGRSAGARVACRTAHELGAAGVVALAFPLHPPGRPEKTRGAELLQPTVPVLVVQGERDGFGRPQELRSGLAQLSRRGDASPIDIASVPYADHSFAVAASAPVTRRECLEILTDGVGAWLARQQGR